MSEGPQSILSVEGFFRHEIDKIKASRFIASTERCSGAEQLSALIARARADFPDANHHCFAWRGESAQDKRCSDDREPYGSAGIPILKALEGRKLFCTAVVVSRIFGGTKLGVGGLVRAYGSAAAEALDLAPKIERPLVCRFALRFAYGFAGAVEGQRVAFDAQVVESEFTEGVLLQMEVARHRGPAFEEALRDACSGAIEITELAGGGEG